MTVVLTDLEGKSKVTVRSGAYWVAKRALVGWDGTGWVQADAAAANRIFAEFIATEPGVGGAEIRVARRATFFDADAPYTALTAQYLSTTPGGLVVTRPATDNDLIQVVGRSVTTKEARVELTMPKEFEIYFPRDVYDTTSEPGLGKADAAWAIAEMATSETCYVMGHFPSNIIGDIISAQLVFDSINASALDIDITGVMAHLGAANNEDTGASITAGDLEQADADNKLQSMSIASLMDAGFYRPGGFFCVLIDPDGVTGTLGFCGLRIRGWCV